MIHWQKSAFQNISSKSINLISLVLSFALYGVIILYFKVDKPDLELHIGFSEKMIADGKFLVHPIFFILIQVFSFFSHHYPAQLFAAFIIFAAAQYFKIAISLKILKEHFGMEYTPILFLGVLALQVVIPIPFFSEYFMVNSLSMNYFHNGTLNISIPFCLALLLNLIRYLKTEERRFFLRSILFAILICLSKPSFLFCFAPVFPFVVLFKDGISRKLLAMVQLSTIIIFIIILQSVFLKSSTSSAVNFEVKFQPFYLFGSIANHYRIFIEGFLIGVLLLFFYLKKIVTDTIILSSLLFVFLGYIISFFFVDYIDGVTSPNFVWQSSIVNYIFVLLGMGYIIPTKSFKQINFYSAVCIVALSTHAICGLLYLKSACILRIFYLSM